MDRDEIPNGRHDMRPYGLGIGFPSNLPVTPKGDSKVVLGTYDGPPSRFIRKDPTGTNEYEFTPQ